MSIKIEIERKFLVCNSNYKKKYSSKEKITQAYLSSTVSIKSKYQCSDEDQKFVP